MTAQTIINVHDAKTHFFKLLERAHSGQEIILAKAGKPYARLMPLAPVASQRRPGRLSRLGPVEAGFFDPLPDVELAATALKQFASRVEQDGFEHLPIAWQHSIRAGGYTHDHRDPFDRMLAAQSEIEKARLVTRDAAFGGFGTEVLW